MNVRLPERLLRELWRYKGVPASFAYSFANFLLAFALQKELSPLGFGVFAIVQVFLQFGMGLSNALFCAPIALLVNAEGKLDAGPVGSFSKVNALACVFGAALLVGISSVYIRDLETLALIFLLACATWLRWFYRALELAENNTTGPALADVYYCLVVLAGTAALYFGHLVTLTGAFLVLALGALAAMLTLSRRVITDIRPVFRAKLDIYRASFQQHGRWAVIGAVTNETTANGYAYLVTGIVGPAAFAPIAAMNLFYRPVTILIQSLTQYERPRMIRSARMGHHNHLAGEVHRFRLAAVAGAIGNFALAEALLFLSPRLIGNANYPRDQLVMASFLLGAIYLLRSIRAADIAAVQVLGMFRQLAGVTVITAPLTMLVVLLVLWLIPQLVAMTLIGVLVGEAVICVMLIVMLRRRIQARATGSDAF